MVGAEHREMNRSNFFYIQCESHFMSIVGNTIDYLMKKEFLGG